MEKIKSYIALLEDQYIEKDIESLSPKDRLNFWILVKEFEIPKLQRTNFQHGDDSIHEIIVKYIGPNET